MATRAGGFVFGGLVQLNTFTFRHVMHALGIPQSNENSWAVGLLLVKIAGRKGIEPRRLLTEKTDPAPSVAAPHCIAHYPMTLYRDAIGEVNEWYGDRRRQLGFNFNEGEKA